MSSCSGTVGKARAVALTALVGTLAFSAVSMGGRSAAGHALKAAGHALKGEAYTSSRRYLTTADECGCDCTAVLANAAAGFSSSKGGSANGVSSPSKPMIGGAPSPAPTAEEYWIVYFTDGEIGESYVWWMESDAEQIRMNVLLDSTGEATGLVSDLNNTHVIFGTADGGIYSVSTDGYGLTEIVEDMGDVTAIGAMDIDYNENMLYFVNSDNGEIWRVKTDGSSAQKLTDLIPDAFGVAVDAHKSMLFVRSVQLEVHVHEQEWRSRRHR